MICGIPDDATDDNLEETVIKILADIDVVTEIGDIEACHRFGNSDRKKQENYHSFSERKHCKRALVNRKKLVKVDSHNYFFLEGVNCL